MTDEALADLREAVAELLDVTSALDGSPIPGARRHQVLLGIIAAEYEHVSVINQLSEGLQVRSAEVLLRTLLEGWIIALYVTPDETDRRADSYVMKPVSETKRFLQRIRTLAEQNPGDDQETFLRIAGLTSLEDCEERIAQVNQRIEKVRAEVPPISNFPSIAKCARSIGPRVEFTYANLYGLLLSEEVHVGAGGAFRRVLDSTDDSPERRANTMRKVLFTAYCLYFDLVNLASQHLGRPEQSELTRFADRREQLRGLV